MSIRHRLILSYIAMFAIPLIISAVTAVILLSTNLRSLEDSMPGKMENVFSAAPGLVYEMLEVKNETPEKLIDMNYLRDLETRLENYNIGIFIIDGDKYVYKSSVVNVDELEGTLLKSAERGHERFRDHLVDSILNDSFKVNGITYQMYIVADTRPIISFLGNYFSTLAIFIIIIIAVTNGILTFWVSRSILKPLRALGNGVTQIKEGNLDFKMTYNSSDELGQVCKAFEEMRLKLKESIEQKLQYEENRKELISNISHDLKTPITSIKGYVEGIRDKVADTPEKVEKYMDTIHTKALYMDKLIDDLFMFSKLDLRKLPFDFESVNVKKYFEDMMEEISVELEKKGFEHSLLMEVDPQNQVSIDRSKLKRVVLNIIDNSVKYNDKIHKKLEISVNEEKDYIAVEVKDNGKGIKNEDVEKIFERFYRTDNARNSETGGSGLGLPIAKQLIEGMGGFISASSVLGEGTSIKFTLKKVGVTNEEDSHN